ncbi:MAG: SDR family oxidoreductase, partial [Halobacteria archaeon]|nr:SDR family oxidoreductase [Halobacteria archaeon]
IQIDVRNPDDVHSAAEEAIDEFGEVNIVINNASAIQIANVEDVPAKRFDLMNEVNVRGTYITSRAFLPHLKEIGEGWILSNSPPVKIDRSGGKAAYAWSKMGMSFITLSLAEELKGEDIGCNSFWPVTAIDTRATRYFGMGTEQDWRTPEIVSDAVLEILSRDPAECSGNAFYDEEILAEAGVTDFSDYAVVEGSDPGPMSALLFDPEFERDW